MKTPLILIFIGFALMNFSFIKMDAQTPGKFIPGKYRASVLTVSSDSTVEAMDSIHLTPQLSDVEPGDVGHWNDTYQSVRDNFCPSCYVLLGVQYDNPNFVNSLFYSKISSWPGSTSQYVRADGSIATFPTLFSGAYADLTGKPTIPAAQIQSDWTQASTGALDYIKNKPSLTSGTVTSVGITSTDLSVLGSPVTTSGSFTLNLNTSGVTAGTYEFITVNSKGIVTAGYNSSSSAITKSLNTAYQASSTTRTYDLVFSLKTIIGAGLISTSDGTLDIQISANGSTGWISVGLIENANSGVLAAQNTQGGQLLALDIPAGYYYKIVATTVSGTVTSSYVSGRETLRK